MSGDALRRPSSATKPVINAALWLPLGRSGPRAPGLGAKWMENDRAIAVFSRAAFQTFNHDQLQPSSTARRPREPAMTSR